MNVMHRPKIVVLGMMTKMPVAGVIWQTAHYLVGLERLGYDAYYVEAHARTPTSFMETPEDDASPKAAAYIEHVMRRFGLERRWAFQALHGDGRCYGLSDSELRELYRSAALIINLHGGTTPRPEHYATGRLVFLETDPVELQIELYHNRKEAIEFLQPHCAFFTFGENYGARDCQLPVSKQFHFRPTRQPVVTDFWSDVDSTPGVALTTIGNWAQPCRSVQFKGRTYQWSKHYEFLKFIDLPRKTQQPLELALSSYSADDQRMLEGKGWSVRHALDLSTDPDSYRAYVAGSRGEFTVAKDQNIRLRSGWFSDRSATYLAAGRPVITQDTGFGNILPTGEGLFAFSRMKDVTRVIEAINGDYEKHRRAARAIARDYFSHEVVLGPLLREVGL
jgi:hypothetical protein